MLFGDLSMNDKTVKKIGDIYLDTCYLDNMLDNSQIGQGWERAVNGQGVTWKCYFS